MVKSTLSESHRPNDYPPTVSLRQAFVAMLVTLVTVVVLFSGYFVLVKFTVLDQPGPSQVTALLSAATVLAAAVVYWLIIRRGGVTLQQLGFVRPTRRLLHLLWQAPLAVSTSAGVAAAVLTLTGSAVRTEKDSTFGDLSAMSMPVALVALVLVAIATPLWEEALFRGAFYLGLRRHLGPVGAVLGSAAAFAAFHPVPVLWAFLFPLGLFLGWLRWFHRSLWGSAGVHAFNNVLAATALFSVR